MTGKIPECSITTAKPDHLNNDVLAQLIEEWLLDKRGLSKQTLKDYSLKLYQFRYWWLSFCTSKAHPREMTPSDCKAFVSYLQDDREIWVRVRILRNQA